LDKDLDKTTAWFRFSKVPGLGPVIGLRLLNAFGSPEAVFGSDISGLRKIEGVGSKLAGSVLSGSFQEEAKKDLDYCMENDIQVVHLGHPDYPEILEQIASPPLLLFVRGNLSEKDKEAVSIVGCRNPDSYGESMAMSIASDLAKNSVTVVSGMARGIDGIAQKSALKAGGRTIAVLGTGIDVVYPPEHDKLYQAVMESGAVISEFPLGARPDPGNFPRRNRIISGMSLGVVVVQAMSRKSGTLITVRHALEQDREVFAVPGNAGSKGGRVGNALIKEGAKLVEDARDVLIHLRPIESVELDNYGMPDNKKKRPDLELPGSQAKLYALVPVPSEGTIDIDALSRQAGVPANEAAGAVLELELAGLIKGLPGKRYVRIMDR
jgi:DNA processing protein